MEAGADDCLSKPIPWAELRVRLKAGFRVIRLQERLTAARQELYEQATHDGLTGLWNRRTIVETLRYEVARSQRATTPLALIMADIDHFKRVNDVYGHLTGDRALTETARSITSALRPYDSAGRYGGEEFLIVAPGCDRAASVALAERLRRTVAGSPIAEGAGTIKLSCSFGVAWYDGSLPLLSDHLLRSADRALYAAKRKGRNRVEIAAANIVEADIQHLAEPCLV
jgi:diguanylate cyclase (GGDEF)-like protein